jgi:hypothetical protein
MRIAGRLMRAPLLAPERPPAIGRFIARARSSTTPAELPGRLPALRLRRRILPPLRYRLSL